MASPIYLQRKSRRGPTFREVVLMHAIGRIANHGTISNVQASWVKIGVDGVRQLLQVGVNDLGGTLMNENISRAAGATHGQGKTPAELADLVMPSGGHCSSGPRCTANRSGPPLRSMRGSADPGASDSPSGRQHRSAIDGWV